MHTKDWFKINGVSSDVLTNVLVNTPPALPIARRKTQSYSVGRDENVVTKDTEYENITYSIQFDVIDPINYDKTEISNFLTGAKTLEISRLEGFYFRIKNYSNPSAVQKLNGMVIRYQIDFVLSPFQYLNDNEWQDIQSGDILTNQGNTISKPILEVTGAGRTTFSCNGEEFFLNLPENPQTVIVDSERYLILDKSTNAMLFNFMGGKFPQLNVGVNQITWDTSATVKIKPNWRVV